MASHRTLDRRARTAGRLLMGVGLLTAGVGHLSFAREGFQAQVPDFIPMDKDAVVLISGGVELTMGAGAILLPQAGKQLGWLYALFFAAIFPGNLHQYAKHIDALGMDTDTKRLVRLFGQPLMIAVALWSTGALTPGNKA